MSKFYEVKLTTTQYIVVEVSDGEDAGDAIDLAMSNFEPIKGSTDAECSEKPLEDEALSFAIESADATLFIN